jgi:branched-chain amino acid transport system ATP-binding protein
MSRPKCLLLDEPSLGIAPLLVRAIFKTIQEINTSLGIGILLVEQNAHLALEIADTGYVMETGRVLYSDAAEKLRTDERVIAAYLGG